MMQHNFTPCITLTLLSTKAVDIASVKIRDPDCPEVTEADEGMKKCVAGLCEGAVWTLYYRSVFLTGCDVFALAYQKTLW